MLERTFVVAEYVKLSVLTQLAHCSQSATPQEELTHLTQTTLNVSTPTAQQLLLSALELELQLDMLISSPTVVIPSLVAWQTLALMVALSISMVIFLNVRWIFINFWALTVESIGTNRFHGLLCPERDNISARRCTIQPGAFMGGDSANFNKNLRGSYYLETNRNSPFGQGTRT